MNGSQSVDPRSIESASRNAALRMQITESKSKFTESETRGVRTDNLSKVAFQVTLRHAKS